MKDGFLKFDTIVAACALLMSSVTAAAMVYQTRVLEEQFSATIWPYLSVEQDHANNLFAVRIRNDGAGPALIRSAKLQVDGKDAAGWDEALGPVGGMPGVTVQSSSMDASTALRAGEEVSLLAVTTTNRQALADLTRHRLVLHLCYCSINQRCWRLDEDLGSLATTIPKPADCRGNSRIDAQSLLRR